MKAGMPDEEIANPNLGDSGSPQVSARCDLRWRRTAQRVRQFALHSFYPLTHSNDLLMN